MASKTAAKGREKGKGAICKNRNRFYLRIKKDGQTKTFLLRNEDDTYCTTRSQAEDAAERLIKTTSNLDTEERFVEAIAEIRDLKNKSTVTIPQLWEMYRTSPTASKKSTTGLDVQLRIWTRFAEWLKEHGVKMANEITSQLLSEYMTAYGKTVSNRTFNGTLMALNPVIREAVKRNLIAENPFDNRDIEKRPLETISRQEFTAEQVQAIFDCFRDGFHYESKTRMLNDGTQRTIMKDYKPLYADEMEVLLKLCCFTGCDGESGCLMKWDNVNLETNSIHYVREKTRKKTGGLVIDLPIHPTLREALLGAQGWRQPDSPYILPKVAIRYKTNRWGVQKDVQKIIHMALGVDVTNHNETGTQRALAANVYSLHSFRHTFVSFCANAGVPMAVVASIVGHGSPAMTRHYAHISTEAKGKAIETLPILNQSPVQAQPVLETAEQSDRSRLHALIDDLDDSKVARLLEVAEELSR